MRPFILLLACAAMGAPGAARSQALSPPDPRETPPAPVLAPFPELAPAIADAPTVVAPPPPQVAGVAAPKLETPTDSAPVLIEEKPGVGGKVGKVAVGMAGGAAGAVVLGPVGKFAGSFIGKRLAGKLFGDDGIPQVTEPVPASEAKVAASADKTGRPAAAKVETASAR